VIPSRVIDPAARLRLESAVIEAERSTSGEIVVNVVRACDEYGSAGWRCGVMLAGAAFLALAEVHARWPLPWLEGHLVSALLLAELVALALGHALARLDGVRRLFVSRALREHRVAERARRAFAERGLARTAGRSGILLFVALFERRAVVLADEGIHRALGSDESWDEVLRPIVSGLREGRAVEGLLAAVRRCGEILARRLPAAARQVNELPDPVVLED
jgi:putative membrane protein